jgi:hypothetical protein
MNGALSVTVILSAEQPSRIFADPTEKLTALVPHDLRQDSLMERGKAQARLVGKADWTMDIVLRFWIMLASV